MNTTLSLFIFSILLSLNGNDKTNTLNKYHWIDHLDIIIYNYIIIEDNFITFLQLARTREEFLMYSARTVGARILKYCSRSI